jgi:alpha-1,2-mannosyltransferase
MATGTAARPASSPTPRRSGRPGLQVLAVCLAVAAGWWFATHALDVHPVWHHEFDLRVYRGAVQWWLDDRPLYAFVRPHTSMGFTYPPFAILCLLPLALGTEATATVLITLVSAAALLVTTTWLVAPVARRHGRPVWFAVALAVPVLALMEPVRETFGWGQVALLLALLVLVDVRALDRGRPWAGVGIGLAAAIKVTPALFIVYLVVTRRWRAAATAAGTALGATLLAAVIDPSASVTYWTRALWQTDRVGDTAMTTNQSVFGVLSRLASPQPPDRAVWAVLVLAVAVAGLWRAARAARDGDELTGFTITGLTAALVSPISWTHHFFWVVPAALVLADLAAGTPPAAARRRPWLRAHPAAVRVAAGAAAAAVVVAFVVSVIWYFHLDTVTGRDGVAGVIGENAYPLIALALLFIPARQPVARAATRTTAPPRPAGSSPR